MLLISGRDRCYFHSHFVCSSPIHSVYLSFTTGWRQQKLKKRRSRYLIKFLLEGSKIKQLSPTVYSTVQGQCTAENELCATFKGSPPWPYDVLHSKVVLHGHKDINHMNTDKTEQLIHTSMHEILQVNVCVSKVESTFNKHHCLCK